MFDNREFEKWLDLNVQPAMEKLTSGKALDTQDILFLALKAKTDQIAKFRQDKDKTLKR
jgi:hypothetical protein